MCFGRFEVQRVFLVYDSFSPSRFRWARKIGTTTSADFCEHRPSYLGLSRLSAEDAYSRVRSQISPDKNVNYPCPSSPSTYAPFPVRLRVGRHTRLESSASDEVSVRSLAGLGENTSEWGSDALTAVDRLGAYPCIRRLPSHGRSPFRSCLHLVLFSYELSIWYDDSR